jgi:hypothetical protein
MPAIIPLAIGAAAIGGTVAARRSSGGGFFAQRQAAYKAAQAGQAFTRRSLNGQTVVGQAVPRPAPGATDAAAGGAAGIPQPPDVGRMAAEANLAGRLASEQVRRRAKSAMLTSQPQLTGRAVRPVLSPRVLKAGY